MRKASLSLKKIKPFVLPFLIIFIVIVLAFSLILPKLTEIKEMVDVNIEKKRNLQNLEKKVNRLNDFKIGI